MLKVDFERSGRGQEPSRGHKFSILENLVLHRDFTSSMHLHFRSDLVGACLPQTLLIFAPCGAKEPPVVLLAPRWSYVSTTRRSFAPQGAKSEQGLGQARPNKITSEMQTH